MMVPKKSLFFAGATLLCMSSAFAQSAQTKKARRVSNKVMNTVGVDLQTGVITRGPAIKQKSAGPGATTALSVNNLDFGGFIGIDSGQNGLNGPCEWYSSVLKGFGNTGGLSLYVSNVVFAYCGIAKDVISGGPGTRVTFNFWDGFSNGSASTAGVQGTNVGSATVTGLPGHTGTTAWLINGFAVCVVNLVNLNVAGGAPICLPDSNVAISYLFDDVDSLGVLGNTSTFLSCTTSCSAAPFLPNNVLDQTGMNDYIDNYCGGSFLTSFSFVTGTFFTVSFTSLSFGLGEFNVVDASDSKVSLNTAGGATCNTSTLDFLTFPFVGAPNWNTTVNCGTIPGALTAVFVSFAETSPGACISDKTGTFFCNPALGARALTAFGFRAGPDITINVAPFGVPKDCNFIGVNLCAQAYCANSMAVPSGQTRLSNGGRVTVGTQE